MVKISSFQKTLNSNGSTSCPSNDPLEAQGVGVRSLTESIDTTTSGGRLIFHVFGALGQFERYLIRNRTKVGFLGRPLTQPGLAVGRIMLHSRSGA